MRYFLKLAYQGTEFHGWQIQPDVTSVQEEIEEKLTTIFQKKTSLVGCGRTDTGVHAREFYAHFDTDEQISLEQDHLLHKLNTMLHPHIGIESIFEVRPDAHARFDATRRSYEYHISRIKDPFNGTLSYKLAVDLDLKRMNKACELLLGEQDFGCFCKTRADNHTNLCTVYSAGWKHEENKLIFRITANRFLRNMVRAIVGTMLDIGQVKIEVSKLKNIIASQDRTMAGRSVPAHGLYLTKVEYPSEIFQSNL